MENHGILNFFAVVFYFSFPANFSSLKSAYSADKQMSSPIPHLSAEAAAILPRHAHRVSPNELSFQSRSHRR